MPVTTTLGNPRPVANPAIACAAPFLWSTALSTPTITQKLDAHWRAIADLLRHVAPAGPQIDPTAARSHVTHSVAEAASMTGKAALL
jgi:hypothetical protein